MQFHFVFRLDLELYYLIAKLMVIMIELSLLIYIYISIGNIYIGFYKTKQLSFINTILIIMIFYQHQFYK